MPHHNGHQFASDVPVAKAGLTDPNRRSVDQLKRVNSKSMRAVNGLLVKDPADTIGRMASFCTVNNFGTTLQKRINRETVQDLPPCDNEMKADVILEHFCASEFALKMKIKEIKREKGDRKILSQRKKKVLKAGPLKKKDLKKLVLFIKNGASCPCTQLDNPSSNFLIMGRKWDNQLLLTVIHKWDKRNKELRYAVKMMKSYQCPTYHHVFQ
ncbi:secreted frizzled-related protein 1-like [Callorhinchus milii]|uniref:secreted frizzled-related protein 1-like n=1 Tax=Callorhinchus milii TaxID=7868 RepID=UPI001C3FA2F0|nr:secreted frizzled-related protein 1-like [Callorhinchus milii]